MTATLEKEMVGDVEMEEGATPDVVEEEQSGHIAHSKSAEEKGLPGQMRRPDQSHGHGRGVRVHPHPRPRRAANPRRTGRDHRARGH